MVLKEIKSVPSETLIINSTIPKIIHYCWFGGNPLPELAVRCIKSWEKYCPDYEIRCWDETNFDCNCNTYVKEAYNAKKWAFVTDYVRLYVLVTYGGIYMDTDVEVLKSLDKFLKYDAVSGFENKNQIPTGLMACKKGQPMFRKLLDDYVNRYFIKSDGTFDLTTNVETITNYCLKYGLKLNNKQQIIEGLMLFPSDYFCPKEYDTGVIRLTENSHTIHHFDGSWVEQKDKNKIELQRRLRKYMPRRIAYHVSDYYYEWKKSKFNGISQLTNKKIKKYFKH